ncbi:hypothetical protein HI113_22265 [Corallococcus exiguus]|uniref:hypothetical protein n=1 Tax=Corallococcus exiguus TaxID=83462 RepID=UPI001473D4AE|nr:hypothetical protein [Corallococcus exiguus]NNB96627.1 hypothetical protein [Corallococcus exiguus]
MNPRDVSPVSRPVFQSSVALLLLSIFTLQVGCSRSPETSPWTLEKTQLLQSRILHREVQPAQVVDNHLERYGRVQVRGEEGQAPHMLAFVLRQELTRGDGTTVIDILDEETGSKSHYEMHDETGEALIVTDAGQQKMAFNADGTIRVGDAMAKNAQEAADLLHKSGVMDPVSDYSLVVLLDTIHQYIPESDTSKGQVVAAVVVVVWLTGSWYFCSREYSRKNCNTNNGMTQYCRDYCRQVGCSCWR